MKAKIGDGFVAIAAVRLNGSQPLEPGTHVEVVDIYGNTAKVADVEDASSQAWLYDVDLSGDATLFRPETEQERAARMMRKGAVQ